ncbi:retrovirus-related Pol polyprotein from transposon 17.6 [Trichonephila clavipes]|nr:retrovirus-related Pol polyprotein from transposon 17.6 [Trichonephila clavipes]
MDDLLIPSKNEAEENPILQVFQQDYPLELHTDASSLGFDRVLLQNSDDGLFHPIHYFSHKATVQQEKYSSYGLEVLAIIEELKKFRSYLLDKGSAFTSTEFKKFCQDESIEHIQITTGVPRGNGKIERIHKTIIPVLTKLTIEEPEKWFKHVHRLQRIMNSTTTRSTKLTPFEVLIGVKMKQKEDLKIEHLLEDELREQFIDERETLRNEAKGNILTG